TFSNNSDVTFEWNQTATADYYDFMDVAAHELDEALGIGSALTSLPNNGPIPVGDFTAEDYFRYQTGTNNRLITTNPNANVSFSYNGGATDVAQFNQDSPVDNPNDRNDWIYGNGATAPLIPYVQDGKTWMGQVAPILTSSTGQTPESIVLNVL